MIDTLTLKTVYKDLMNHPDDLECQQAYFDAFPSTALEFTCLFGFCSQEKNLYDAGYNYIQALGERVPLIPDSVYCRKLINISIGLIYEADASNYFKSVLHNAIWQKMEVMFRIISTLSKGYQLQFWQIYWANLYRKEKLIMEFERLKKLNEDRYPEEVRTMSIAYEYFCGGHPFYSFFSASSFIKALKLK
jgi:hypothetical protein